MAADSTSRYERVAEELESLAQGDSDALLQNNAVRKRLLDAIKAAIPEVESFEDSLQRILGTPMEIMAGRIGGKMGVFEALTKANKPLTTAEIAPAGSDLPYLNRLLKYIASLNMIKEVDVSTWASSRFTHVLARRETQAGLYMNAKALGPTWQAFPEYLERTHWKQSTDITQTAFNEGNNISIPIFDHYVANPEIMANFNLYMTIQRYGDEFWLDHFPFEKVVLADANAEQMVFVDLGGGIGHQCQSVMKRFPHLEGRVVLQDQAQPIEEALDVPGMRKQVIDFFVEQPVKAARAYYLRNVLHDWNDEHCRKILSHVRAAMSLDSLLLIDEMVIPNRGAHKIAMQMDMTMLGNLAAEERSESRWKALLESFGLKIDQIYEYQHEVANSIIVANIV